MAKLINDGIWLSNGSPVARSGDAALVLDRDGVLVREVNYLSRPQDVQLECGAAELIQWAHERDLAVVVVTNQSGVARGFFDWNAFEAVDREITHQLAERGVAIDLTIACPFHPNFTPDYNEAHSRWRKPGPAMIELAADLLGFSKNASWMIGDKKSDVGAARNAGLAGAVHVLTGHGSKERENTIAMEEEGFRVVAAQDLDDALIHLREIFAATGLNKRKMT